MKSIASVKSVARALSLVGTILLLLCQNDILFATGEESECPSGTVDNGQGSCVNPDYSSDDKSSSSDDFFLEEDSSDDDYNSQQRSGNPHAHIDMDNDPAGEQVSCNEYLNLRGFKYYQESSSFYQELAWGELFGRTGNSLDVCMSLDDIVQICSSYRPHYHEPFVHFPAAYLKELKRVAFIGGGDSMLLAEALKYPDIEMIIGLELDQKNVRESLRHFHTRPHFEDPRVQWWFGDAAKSLALIPREWFGTFDLIMVDLSETGMSISVNDDLDIFSALTMLLKPEGIMVKNEDYFSQMRKYFDYSISVYMDSNPMLCDQDWAMGSNSIDFLRPKLKGGLVDEYNISTLAYLPLDNENNHYKMIIDYANNEICDDDSNAEVQKKQQRPTTPTESSGILLVVEAENTTKNLDLESFAKTLQALGFTPLEKSIFLPQGKGITPSLFIPLEEGYISAHTYQGHQAIGIEILLWSQLGKQNDILQALLGVVGVQDSYSSYRVIHGGMVGHKDWLEELETIGPGQKQNKRCKNKSAVPAASNEVEDKVSTDIFDTIVTKTLAMLPQKTDKATAVICGVRDVDDCTSIASLMNNENVDNVVAIWSCPDIHNPDNKITRGEEDENGKSLSHVYACGEESIMRSSKREESFSALIVDPNADRSLVEQSTAIFCNDKILKAKRHPYLREQLVFVTSLSSQEERQMLTRCNRRISKNLARSATLKVDNTTKVGLIASANNEFVPKLLSMVEQLKDGDLSIEIESMRSGPVPFQQNFNPHHYSADEYNQIDAMKQYSYQQPLAAQSIYQLHISDHNEYSNSVNELMSVVIEKSNAFAESTQNDYAVGDGAVAVAIASIGHLIITWNGASVYTINILTEEENYGSQKKRGGEGENVMILFDHHEIVELIMNKLPSSTIVASHEHMPRGVNRVVNFKYDIEVSQPGCANYYESCTDLANNGKCESGKYIEWMHHYCAMSCDKCDEMIKSLSYK